MIQQNRRRVKFLRLARREYQSACRWYRQHASSLIADAFRHEINEASQRIALDPLSLPRYDEKYHYISLKRFPYVLYFFSPNQSTTLVAAVAHTSRRPGYWKRRR